MPPWPRRPTRARGEGGPAAPGPIAVQRLIAALGAERSGVFERALREAASTGSATLDSVNLSVGQLEALAAATVESGMGLASSSGEVCWRALELASLAQSVAPERLAEAERIIIRPALQRCRERAPATEGTALAALVTGCQTLNDRATGFLLDRQRAGAQLDRAIVEAVRARDSEVMAKIRAVGGGDAVAEAREAELSWLEQQSTRGFASVTEMTEAMAETRARLWKSPQAESLSVLSLERYQEWVWSVAELRATCVALAVPSLRGKNGSLPPTLEGLDGALQLDPIAAAPWAYVDDGLGGRVLRSGPVLADAKVRTVEVAFEGPQRQRSSRPR